MNENDSVLPLAVDHSWRMLEPIRWHRSRRRSVQSELYPGISDCTGLPGSMRKTVSAGRRLWLPAESTSPITERIFRRPRRFSEKALEQRGLPVQ